eukprot:gene17831-19614_t
MYQEHYNLPLPSIENFAYGEQQQNNNLTGEEQQQIQTQQQHYNYDYSRMAAMYGYRNFPDHMMQMQATASNQHHFQNYPQQLDANQHAAVAMCNPMYQQTVYDHANMIPGFGDIAEVNGANRTRHKRSRMSLQKRLLVNARERERMRVLNKAFEALRDALPCYIADGHMAKITTLRLAINYIKALTEVLEEQRALDLEKEKNGGVDAATKGITATTADNTFSLSCLKITDDDRDIQSKFENVDENAVKSDTIKVDIMKPQADSG